jgi:hypothetical protein
MVHRASVWSERSSEISSGVEVGLEFPQLRHGDSPGTQKKGTFAVGRRYQRTGEDVDD